MCAASQPCATPLSPLSPVRMHFGIAAPQIIIQVQKRRIYDITNVLEGVGLIEKKSKNNIRWKGSSATADKEAEPESVRLKQDVLLLGVGAAHALRCRGGGDAGGGARRGAGAGPQYELHLLAPGPITSFAHRPFKAPPLRPANPACSSRRTAHAQEQERTLDEQIKVMGEAIKSMSDNPLNKDKLYMTDEDITRLPVFASDTIFAVKAPPGTTLEVPDPEEAAVVPGQRRYRCVRACMQPWWEGRGARAGGTC